MQHAERHHAMPQTSPLSSQKRCRWQPEAARHPISPTTSESQQQSRSAVEDNHSGALEWQAIVGGPLARERPRRRLQPPYWSPNGRAQQAAGGPAGLRPDRSTGGPLRRLRLRDWAGSLARIPFIRETDGARLRNPRAYRRTATTARRSTQIAKAGPPSRNQPPRAIGAVATARRRLSSIAAACAAHPGGVVPHAYMASPVGIASRPPSHAMKIFGNAATRPSTNRRG